MTTRLILWCAALALIASACGSGVGGSGAASVGDEALSRSEVDQFASDFQLALTQGVADEEEELGLEVVQSGIAFWVQTVALEAELADSITADDRAVAERWTAESYGNVPLDSIAYERIVAWRSTRLALARDVGVDLNPSEAELRARLDEINETQGESACSAHILVGTEAEAQDILAQLEAGADFGELASTISLDPGSGANGGDLGCVAQGAFVAEFDEALWAGQDGDVLGPIQTEFGFHVIQHNGFETTLLVYEEVVDQLRDDIINQREAELSSVHSQFLIAAAANADVAIDPRFGSWNSEVGQLDLPEGAEVEGSGSDDVGDGFITEVEQ